MVLYAASCLVWIECSINSDTHSILIEFGSTKVVNFIDHIKKNQKCSNVENVIWNGNDILSDY